jgi:hypothetical protein
MSEGRGTNGAESHREQLDLPAIKFGRHQRERGSGGPTRDGKTMIGAYVDRTDLYTIQELLIRLTRERDVKMTMQDFIVSALRAECAKHGVKLSKDT